MPDLPDISEIAARDHEEKLRKASEESEYYRDKSSHLGLKPLERFVRYHPSPSKHMRSGTTMAQLGLEDAAEAMATGQPWAVVSGLNPSGPLHFGHKAIFDELLWMQQNGAEVFIPITNDESYTVGKAHSLAASRRIAYEQVIPSIIAMGFEREKTHIFVDSDYPDIYNVAFDLSTKLTLNRALGVFGLDKAEENVGTLFYRGAVQVAQILLPQYEEFGGPRPTVVPVGIDQHPYLLLAREIARKKGFVPPSEIVTRFLPGLDGQGKMSASRPDSAIFLTDPVDVARKKLKKAYTGGSVSADFQREHGGVPTICPVYWLRSYQTDEGEAVRERCASGNLLCGQCKKEGIEDIVAFLEEHQARLPEARERIDDFLLKLPIRSIIR